MTFFLTSLSLLALRLGEGLAPCPPGYAYGRFTAILLTAIILTKLFKKIRLNVAVLRAILVNFLHAVFVNSFTINLQEKNKTFLAALPRPTNPAIFYFFDIATFCFMKDY